jgi:N-acetylneuraminate synthase
MELGKNISNMKFDDKAGNITLEIIRKTIEKYSAELGCISINNRLVGNDQAVFVVAEAACNHMCDMKLAREIIDKAAEAGADAIKFQTYKAEKLVTGEAVAFWGDEKISQLEYYKRLDRFGSKEYEELFRYAEDKGLIGFSSPFDAESAEMLNDIGMPVFKIASCDIPDIQNLKHIAGFGKPIILSTGASTPDEIDRAVETIFNAGNYQLMLLACTLSYPTHNEDANLLRIRTLQARYPGIVIGLSDHAEPDVHMVIPSAAVALGARIIEKHYTLDRSMTGSGHFFAVAPDDLQKMVLNIRLTETVLGDGRLGVAESEKKAWSSARRSIVADVQIEKGTDITSDMIGLKRPSDGLPASMIDQVVGKRAKQSIEPDQKIFLEMLEDQ